MKTSQQLRADAGRYRRNALIWALISAFGVGVSTTLTVVAVVSAR